LKELTISELASAEMLALPFLLTLSFWLFRGVVAAVLPLLVGGWAVLLALLGLRIVDQMTLVSVFSLNVIYGLGIGLGIDYSLLIFHRYREESVHSMSTCDAIARTLQTAGRTVLFSSLTVAVR
jgi:RND superfamily putative drug exporter